VSPWSRDPAELMVTTSRQLRDVCSHLRTAGTFGFDTEFIRENSYRPQLCLVQAGTRDFCAMIDPFQVDMAPFWRLVLDPSLQKIVHAGEQDLEICFLQTSHPPRNIFDVQVAAALVGLHYPLSYGNLVLEMFDIEMQQGKSFTDWSRRPLSEGQLHYAAEDVQHLVALRDELHTRLTAMDRVTWMQEEMAPSEEATTYAYDSLKMVQRLRGWRQMGRRRLAILRELVTWRDSAARDADLPPRTLLRDGAIKNVARLMPKTVSELRDVKDFPRPLARRCGAEVLKTLQMAARLPESDWPEAAPREADPEDKTLISKTIEAVQAHCLAHDLDPGIVGSRANYVDLLHALRSKRRKAISQTRLAKGWRNRFLGKMIANLLTRHNEA